MKNKIDCIDEISVSMFLDDELTPGQRKQMESHLETCTGCRESVRKQEEENARIKEVFKPIPSPDLVPAVMEKLDSPGFSGSHHREQRRQRSTSKNRSNYRWMLVTAASILLVVFLFLWLFLTTYNKSENIETQVILCSAEVEGQEVISHIFKSKKPDVQFIWLEKIK